MMSLTCRRITFFLLLTISITTRCLSQDNFKFPFQDPSLSVDQRVADLVGRMTLQEKLSQLFNHSIAIDRLGIPAYDWWNEGLHGVARAGKASVFPQAIGLSASFNESLLFKVADAISDEARAKHHFFLRNHVHSIYTGLDFWSPNINIFRDPRWGRGQETYGEDPFLTGRMAVNFIKGLQGKDPRYLKTIATAKHYAVHSGPEVTRHQDNVFVNDRDLYDTYLPAFKAAVEEGGVQSVMCAYNRFRDQPCCGSNPLLSHILRGEFGFKGYIVSDCGAVADFYSDKAHHVVGTPARAWGWSLASGTDLNCEEARTFLTENVDSAVDAGLISSKDIDASLGRVLSARFRLGMFDPDSLVPYSHIPMTVVGNDTHRQLNLQIAQQSLVLLKNDGILPLKNIHKVAVIGPNADNVPILLGNYNGQPIQPVTPLQAIRARLGASNVIYAAGCPIADSVYTNFEVIDPARLYHMDNGKLRHGLKAEYFTGNRTEGLPALVRTDHSIQFNWERSPLNGKMEDIFSVRWTGILIPASTGRYVFGGNTRLKINGSDPGISPQLLEAGRRYQLEVVLNVEPFWWANTIEPTASLSWVNTSLNYKQAALDAASKADVVIFCGGISSQLEGEEMALEINGFSHGDRTHINLPAVQEALLKDLQAAGKKIVYINFSGSAVALNWEDQHLNAILQAFYPGETGGGAIARTLFGENNPSGRLPVTFYRSVDDLPPFKDYSMQGRTYRYFMGRPLYAFGYGLSYTHFTYSNIRMPSEIDCGQPLEMSADVTNDGSMDGDEVVEVYLSHHEHIPGKPVRSLAGFTRLSLKKGETRHVQLTIRPTEMSILDAGINRIVVPGDLEVFIGGCMPDQDAIDGAKVLHKTLKIKGQPAPVK